MSGVLRLAFLGDPNPAHLRRWMSYFLDAGHEVHLLVPQRDPLTAQLDPRIRLHRFDAWPKTRLRGASSLRTSLNLRRLLREVNPDVLHAHYVTRYAYAAWLSRFHPYAVTVWGSDLLVVLKDNRRLRLNARLSLGAADLVTAGSDILRTAAVAAGARPDRTVFVHFGVDTARYRPGPDPVDLRRRLGLVGKRVVLSNRAIADLYRHEVVISALRELPDDVVAVMTRHMATQATLDTVLRTADAAGVADRVKVIDPVPEPEMPDLYRLADVVVSVPASDGGPTTVVEALSTGKPVVATDLPAVREWLDALDPESIVPVGDAAATAAAINRVLARPPEVAEAIAERARQEVIDKADHCANMARMETQYWKLAKRHVRS